MIVLFVGFGSIAQKHRKALLQVNPGAVIYALRSNAEAPSIPGVINIYDWLEMPDNIDFAVIATPTFLHTQSLTILLDKHIPVMLEKPIAASLSGLDSISEIIKKENAFVYIACNLRFLPVLHYLKNYITENKPVINEVNVYSGSYLPAWRPAIDFRKNYSANAGMGGGVHLDLFHEFDYTSWIFGLPQQSVSIKRSASSLNINAIDYAAYIWSYEKFAATIVLNYYRPLPKRTIEIIFEDDIWNVDIVKNEIRNSSNEIIFLDEQYKISDTYVDQMRYMISCLQSNKNPDLNTFNSSLEILKLCLS